MTSIKIYINNVQKEYETKKNDYDEKKLLIEKFLEDNFLSEINLSNVNLSSRVKSAQSLGEKIIRKNDYINYKTNIQGLIDNLKDPIGIRLTCLLDSHEIKLYEELRRVFCVEKEINGKKYFVVNGDVSEDYLAIAHQNQPEKQKNEKDIFRMECKWVDADSMMNVELQLKSLVHMFWGEIEHEIMYKNYNFNKDEDFFTKILNNMSELLHLVDGELESIQSHLVSQKDINGNVRKTDYFIQELNLHIQPMIDSVLGVSIDLRDVYQLITKINNYDPVNFVGFFKMAMLHNLDQIEISTEDFENIEACLINNNHERSYFCYEINKHVSQQIRNGNIHWMIAFIVFYKIKNVDKMGAFVEFIDLLYKPFSDTFNLLHEDIAPDMNKNLSADDEEKRLKLIFDIIQNALKKVFNKILNKNKQFELFLGDQTTDLLKDIASLKILFAFTAENLDFIKLQSNIDAITKYVEDYFLLTINFKYFSNNNENVSKQFEELLNTDGDWLIPLEDDERKEIVSLLDQNHLTEDDKNKIVKSLIDRIEGFE
ncbi:hypothetical protein [Exiguobacterium sp. R-39]|uniref:hypothetical protein n=1 Tax=Exiguobacterium sp. R-39 TaxID=3416708 RepID=UPI003CF4B7FF